jgi:chromosome segregation ATPase
MAGAPVLTVPDLERPLRPMICTDCVRDTGVSTVWDPAAARPLAGGAEDPPAPAHPDPVVPAPGPAEPARDDARLDTLERHLRAVTTRVNELGQTLRAERAASDERRRAEDGVGATLARLGDQMAAVAGVGHLVDAQRAEVAAVVSAVTEIRSELHRLSDANRELVRMHQALEQRLAEAPPLPPSVEPEELAAVVASLDELRRRVAEVETRPSPAGVDAADVERLVTTRLAESEGRLSDRIAGQRGDLESAVEASVAIYGAGLARANEALAGGQADVVQRLDGLAVQLAQVASRLDAMASWAASSNERLDTLEQRTERALLTAAPRLAAAPTDASPGPAGAPAESLLDVLERQLEAAANRLAARSEHAPAE